MKRETRITVTFTHPFQLKGIDRTLPPGDYTILTEEELTNDNASFPVYHRLSTVIFVSSKQSVEMFTIDPVDLQAALIRYSAINTRAASRANCPTRRRRCK